jgi:excinuclease UvrABC nuclease subunit
MYYSIYRIHTDKGTYVGQTKDLISRLKQHYRCKFEKRKNQVMLVRAIRATPDERLKFEELGYYNVSDKSQINCIERYWISKCSSNLNIVCRGVHSFFCEFEEFYRVSRSLPPCVLDILVKS